jgi:hypothetical protein
MPGAVPVRARAACRAATLALANPFGPALTFTGRTDIFEPDLRTGTGNDIPHILDNIENGGTPDPRHRRRPEQADLGAAARAAPAWFPGRPGRLTRGLSLAGCRPLSPGGR